MRIFVSLLLMLGAFAVLYAILAVGVVLAP